MSFGTRSGVYNPVSATVEDMRTDHEVPLTNLNAGTVYYYVVSWVDEDGNSGLSEEKSFATNQPPRVVDVSESEIGLHSATIKFTVTGAVRVVIIYGIGSASGSEVSQNTSASTSDYTVRLTGLEDDSLYRYKFVLYDADGLSFNSIQDNEFTTPPSPKVTNVRIQQVKNTASSTIQVTWESNTQITSVVEFYPDKDESKTRSVVDLKQVKGEHKTFVSSLTPETQYSIVVKGTDKFGNQAVSDIQVITTSTDTRPPAIFDITVDGEKSAFVTQSSESGVQLVVSWTTDEPATSQVEYGEGAGNAYTGKTFEDANLTTEHIVIISNLTPSKVYHLRTISKDKVGNATNSYDIVSVTPSSSDSALELIFNSLRSVFR